MAAPEPKVITLYMARLPETGRAVRYTKLNRPAVRASREAGYARYTNDAESAKREALIDDEMVSRALHSITRDEVPIVEVKLVALKEGDEPQIDLAATLDATLATVETGAGGGWTVLSPLELQSRGDKSIAALFDDTALDYEWLVRKIREATFPPKGVADAALALIRR